MKGAFSQHGKVSMMQAEQDHGAALKDQGQSRGSHHGGGIISLQGAEQKSFQDQAHDDHEHHADNRGIKQRQLYGSRKIIGRIGP